MAGWGAVGGVHPVNLAEERTSRLTRWSAIRFRSSCSPHAATPAHAGIDWRMPPVLDPLSRSPFDPLLVLGQPKRLFHSSSRKHRVEKNTVFDIVVHWEQATRDVFGHGRLLSIVPI